MAALSQIERNEKHRREKGLVQLSALVKPESKELFSDIRQRNMITTAELFEQMLDVYQKQTVITLQSVITLQTDSPEPENVITLQEPEPVIGLQEPEQENVITLQPEPEPENVIGLQPETVITLQDTARINLNMPVEERKKFALALLKSHGGDKKSAMEKLKASLQQQYPGFSANRIDNRVGPFAEPMKFYSSVSDFLGRRKKGHV